jgi:hypothetical protein
VQRGELSNQLQLGQAMPYTPGATLASAITHTLMRPEWTHQDLARALSPYLGYLMKLVGQDRRACFDSNLKLPGDAFDAIPQNLIIDFNGEIRSIDQEWVFSRPIELGFLLFRCMQSFIFGVHRFGNCKDGQVATPLHLVQAAFQSLGIEVASDDLKVWIRMECEIQSLVSGVEQSADERWQYFSNHKLPVCDAIGDLVKRNHELQEIINIQQADIKRIQQSRWLRLGRGVRTLIGYFGRG